MRHTRMKPLTIVCAGLLLGAAACGAQQPGARLPYDGRWWLAASDLKRDGFVVGYLDCYHFEYKGPELFRTKSYQRYRDLVTKFYQDSATRLRPFSEVIGRYRDKPGEKYESPGGEPAHARHGGNDGLYWRQASNEGHDEQLGFVEGYLYCHEKLAKNKGGVFAKTPEEYRALITQWYRFDEKTDDVDAKREPEAIADVLFKVRTGIE
jgi:hypothetical protein